MGRYYSMREYDCPADYYERGNLGTVSPQSIRDRESRESAERARQTEATRQDMIRHHELYGD
jgi:hypothetical protein